MRRLSDHPSDILASFLIGSATTVALSSFWQGNALIIATFIAFLSVLCFLFSRAQSRAFLLLLVATILGGTIGLTRYAGVQPHENSVAFAAGEDRSVEGIVIRKESGENNEKYILNHLSINGEEKDDRVIVYAPRFSTLPVGGQIKVTCDLERPEPFDGFAYDRFLAAKRIYASCFTREAPFVVDPYAVRNANTALADFHDRANDAIEAILGEPHAALLRGLLLGDDAFSPEWKERFLNTGTTHIVAASGTNVALTATLTLAALIALGLWRRQAYPLVIAAIFAFVLIAGAEGAVTRAGIMGALALTARHVGRKTPAHHLLLVAAGVMLLIEPRLLRDDPGFQLSVLSTWGLLTLSRPIASRLEFIPDTFGIREGFGTTLAATLVTLPLVVTSFGRVSLVAPIANLLVLPLLPIAMLTGSIASLVGLLSQPLGALLALPAHLALSLALLIIRSLSEVSFAVIDVPENLKLWLGLLSIIATVFIIYGLKKTDES